MNFTLKKNQQDSRCEFSRVPATGESRRYIHHPAPSWLFVQSRLRDPETVFGWTTNQGKAGIYLGSPEVLYRYAAKIEGCDCPSRRAYCRRACQNPPAE